MKSSQMKILNFLSLALLLVLFAGKAWAQGGRGPMDRPVKGHEGRFDQRLNAIKMYKLVELLNLDEEKAAKLAIVMKVHREKVAPLMDKFKGIEDKMRDETDKKNPDLKELEKLISSYLDTAKSLQKEREGNQEQVLSILTPVQKGKYLLFHERFPREFRGNMRDFMMRNIHKFKDKLKNVWPEKKEGPQADETKSS